MPIVINGYWLRSSARHSLTGGRKQARIQYSTDGSQQSRDIPKPRFSLCFLQLSQHKKLKLGLFTSYLLR